MALGDRMHRPTHDNLALLVADGFSGGDPTGLSDFALVWTEMV